MYPEFAYSGVMQFLLAVQSYVTHAVSMFLIANLILFISNEKATFKQKCAFSLWMGSVFYTSFIYLAYFIGGKAGFTPLMYSLIVGPNPIFAFLFYVVGGRILKLSPIRSIKLIGYFFAYFVFIYNIMRLCSALWPIETEPHYNYLQNAYRQGLYLILIIAVYFLTKYAFSRTKLRIKLVDNAFIDIKKERVYYCFEVLFLYGITVCVPMMTLDFVAGPVIVMLLVALFFALNILLDLSAVTRVEMNNQAAHIGVLSKAVNDFGSVKHDLNNILQTYSGYLEIGSLEGLKKYHASVIQLSRYAGGSVDLCRKMTENPAFIALLSSKTEYAERANLDISVSLLCNADNLYMDNLDLCRCVSCLLDNAIESALESELRKVAFTLERKPDGSKLIIVTNSTAGAVDTANISISGNTSKKGHNGLGLPNVRKILSKYGNCAFNMTYYNCEFAAYMELRAP